MVDKERGRRSHRNILAPVTVRFSGQKKRKRMQAVDAVDTWVWKNMGQPSK